MCIISATAIATALGISTAATIGSTSLTVAGTIAGVANTLLAATAIGSGISGVAGSVQASNAEQAQADYQAKVAQRNAEIAENNAMQERQAGLEDARRQRIRAIQAIGNQEAGIAANGAEIGSGTALDIIEDTAQAGELDALMTQYNAERRAINYEQQAENFNNQANLYTLRSQNAATAGKINTVGAAFKGLSSGLNLVAGSGLGVGGFGTGNSFGTTLNHFKSNLTNGLTNLTTGVRTVQKGYANAGTLS